MGALALQLGGTAVGSFFGPLGAAVGGAVGSILGNLLFPPKPQQIGPRITDRAVESSAYGAPIVDSWGTFKLSGLLIDSSDLRERKHKVKQGKGFLSASPSGFYYTYSVDACWLFRRREAEGFLRFWCDTKLVRNPGSTATLAERVASGFSWKGGSLRFYSGAENQLPDPRLEALHGVGNVPAHRGVVTIVAYDLELADFGNRVPGVSAEIFDNGVNEIALDSIGAASLDNGIGGTDSEAEGGWVHVDQNGEILVLKSTIAISGVRYAVNSHLVQPWRITPEGNSYLDTRVQFNVDLIASLMPGVSDVPAYAVAGRQVSGDTQWLLYDVAEGLAKYYDYGPNGAPAYFVYDLGLAYGVDIDAQELLVYGSNGGTPSVIDISALNEFVDMGASTDYLYAITITGTGANPHQIYKISREDFSLIDTFVPAISDHTSGFQVSQCSLYVVSDTEIYISVCAANDGPVHLYRYNPESDTSVYLGAGALGAGNAVNAGERTRLIYGNGIFYFGSQFQTLAVSTDHKIYRFVEAGSAEATTLGEIVGDCCKLAGLKTSQYDVSELTDEIWGYARDAQTSPADMIRALMVGYAFDAAESDGKIKFKKRGGAVEFSITSGDLAAHALGEGKPDTAPVKQVQERQLPVKVRVQYVQKDKDYERGEQYAERIISDYRNAVDVAVPVAMSDTEAKRMAEKLLPQLWSERNSRELQLSRKWIKLEVADPIEITL